MGQFEDKLLRKWAISKILKITYYENVQFQKCVTSKMGHFDDDLLRNLAHFENFEYMYIILRKCATSKMCHFGKYVTSKMGRFEDDLLRNGSFRKQVSL